MTADAALALELRALRAAVAAVSEDLQHTQRRLLAADDRAIAQVLVPLVHDLLDDAEFTAATLTAAALSDRTPLGQAVRELLAEYGSVKSLGRLFERIAGAVFDGARLERLRETRNGWVCRVVRVSEP